MSQPVFKMAVSQYRKKFIGKAPCTNSLIKWIETGIVPGEKIGTMYYLLVDQHGELVKERPIHAEDELLNRIIGNTNPRG